jgi:hypothetical protein
MVIFSFFAIWYFCLSFVFYFECKGNIFWRQNLSEKLEERHFFKCLGCKNTNYEVVLVLKMMNARGRGGKKQIKFYYRFLKLKKSNLHHSFLVVLFATIRKGFLITKIISIIKITVRTFRQESCGSGVAIILFYHTFHPILNFCHFLLILPYISSFL